MPSNVEIKARVGDMDRLLRRAEELSQSEGTVIHQEDTFFNVPQGRLKLRQFENGPGQLIFYQREDSTGPKMSDYHFTMVDNPDELRSVLTLCLGVRGTVRKRRVLHLVGQTRVHMDLVENLGSFMELEVLLSPGETAEYGKTIADDLMKQLGINESDLLAGAYIDMLLNTQ